ncbi:putative membrane domain protein [[Clostridium] sordellii ATCC 9714]|nr:putative membrane domain protein [[Clostridium] sordellii ATCC 9714] [Paeniclostridium sordellii ATCC 9714]
MVAFVSVEDFNIVGIGDTKEEALRSYREQLKSKGNNVQVENDNTKVVKTGTVKRISSDVIDGNTSYYFTLEGINDSIFIVSSKVSHEVPLTKEGDSIKISYDKEHKGNIDILEFDNISMNQKEEQVQKEETNQ